MLEQLKCTDFFKQAKEYIANPALEHEPYRKRFCSSSEAEKALKLLKEEKGLQGKLYESLVKNYKKAGLKNFIGNWAVNYNYLSASFEKEMLNILHLLKSKYLDSSFVMM